jgi:transposase InsO family protein
MDLSERRACQIVGADRTMVRYRSRRPPETELRTRLRDLANERRRFGYRRLFILLRNEGEASGVNRIYRLYREEGLSVRKRKARRRATGTRAPILVEARPNARWSIDFVHDQFVSIRPRTRSPAIGFVDVDEVYEVFDTERGERYGSVFAERRTIDPDDTVFGVHFVDDVEEPVFIFAQFGSDMGKCPDCRDLVQLHAPTS